MKKKESLQLKKKQVLQVVPKKQITKVRAFADTVSFRFAKSQCDHSTKTAHRDLKASVEYCCEKEGEEATVYCDIGSANSSKAEGKAKKSCINQGRKRRKPTQLTTETVKGPRSNAKRRFQVTYITIYNFQEATPPPCWLTRQRAHFDFWTRLSAREFRDRKKKKEKRLYLRFYFISIFFYEFKFLQKVVDCLVGYQKTVSPIQAAFF